MGSASPSFLLCHSASGKDHSCSSLSVPGASLVAWLGNVRGTNDSNPESPSLCILPPPCKQRVFGQRSILPTPPSPAADKQKGALHIKEPEKALGKVLRWHSMVRFSFRCYFLYLVGIPALTLGSGPLSSLPALCFHSPPFYKPPVHLHKGCSQPNSSLGPVLTRS